MHYTYEPSKEQKKAIGPIFIGYCPYEATNITPTRRGFEGDEGSTCDGSKSCDKSKSDGCGYKK